jgi:hypothetical protein
MTSLISVENISGNPELKAATISSKHHEKEIQELTYRKTGKWQNLTK